jgi:hypothetical protein
MGRAQFFFAPPVFMTYHFVAVFFFPDSKEGLAMDDTFRLIALLGAIALCTIVGIYYIWVRKLSKPENDPVHHSNRHTPQ